MSRFKILLILVVSLFQFEQVFAAEKKLLSIAARGGHYEDVQRLELFNPFEKATGVTIITMPYYGGVNIMRNKFAPDLLDMREEDAIEACALGLARPSVPDELAIAATENEVSTEFITNAFFECGLAHSTHSHVVAYNENAFTGVKPESIGALFDIEQFPGMRAIKKTPDNILEWGLLAEGVPTSQVYDLLSTERGIRLSLDKLSSIREHIIWSDSPKEAVALLRAGEVVMAAGVNGDFFDAWLTDAPIVIIWDGQIIDRSVWVLPAESNLQTETALAFVKFATRAQQQASMAQRVPYGPTRMSALPRIGFHPDKPIKMQDQLPSAKHHIKGAVYRDTDWYANTRSFRNRLFSDWLESE